MGLLAQMVVAGAVHEPPLFFVHRPSVGGFEARYVNRGSKIGIGKAQGGVMGMDAGLGAGDLRLDGGRLLGFVW